MNRRRCLIAFLWASACMGSAAAQEPQFLGRTRQQWVDHLESGFRQQRSHAAWGLQEFAAEQLNSQNAVIWLNELLILTESKSPSVRYWGTVGLGRMIAKLELASPVRGKALESLTQLLKDPSPAVRIAAADALEQGNDKSAALAVLVEAMAHPQDAVRIQAVTALERWREAARPAAQTLRSAAGDSSEYVKRISARALAKLDGKSP